MALVAVWSLWHVHSAVAEPMEVATDPTDPAVRPSIDQKDRQTSPAKDDTHGASAADTSAPATGNIEGVVIYEADRKRPWRYRRYYIADRKKGYLAEAVVALTGSKIKRNAPKPPASAKWVVDQENFRFVPEISAIRVGDTVTFTNSDPETHNVNASSGLDRFNINIGRGQEHAQSFRHSGGIRRPVRLGCVFHSGMRCWIFVFAHPYYQITKADGRFCIEDVPPGKYELAMAHPAGDLRWNQKVNVIAGQTVRVEIRVSPDDKQ